MKIYPVIDVSKGIKVKQIKNVEAHCKIDIQAYEVSEGELSRTVVCSRINKASRYYKLHIEPIWKNPPHMFLIKDVNRLTNAVICGDCKLRFTQVGSLARHRKEGCSKGRTKIVFPGKKVKAPDSKYEQAFFPNTFISYK